MTIGTFISWGTSLTDIYSDPSYTFYTMEFKNGFGDVYVHSYRNIYFVYPYITVIACLSIGIFFTVVLTYINRRIRDVLCLKQEILLMASGDLSHPVPPCGLDEIGTLSRELNHLRTALAANIEIEPEQIPVEFLFRCLKENMDFIQLSGFTVPKLSKLPDATMNGDKTMLKRIFNNLFSNILKYGDKSVPITLSLWYEPFFNPHEDSDTMQLAIRISNQIKSEAGNIASNGIGLKSVQKMTELHHGTLRQWETSDAYFTELCFPVTEITPAKILLHEFAQ